MSTVNKAPVEARGGKSDLIKSNYLLRYSSGHRDPTDEIIFLEDACHRRGGFSPQATGHTRTSMVTRDLTPRSYAHVLFTCDVKLDLKKEVF